MKELDLPDIYRQFHEGTKSFTYDIKNSKLNLPVSSYLALSHIMLKEPSCALP